MRKQDIYDGMYLLNFHGKEMETIDVDLINKISTLYAEIYNESCGEKWTLDSARDEVMKSFKYNKNRIPVGSFLFTGDNNLIGFSWGILTSVEFLDKSSDMPFDLAISDKENGICSVRNWLGLVKKNKLLLFREFGISKEQRGNNFGPLMALHNYKTAYNNGYTALLLWTNTDTPAFLMGLSARWSPIHFFWDKKKHVLLMGGTKYVMKMLEDMYKGLNMERIKEGYKKAFRDIAIYYIDN